MWLGQQRVHVCWPFHLDIQLQIISESCWRWHILLLAFPFINNLC